jgi:hypothetical protein
VFAKDVCDDHEFVRLEPHLCVVGPDEDIIAEPTAAQHPSPKIGDGVSASKVADSKGPTAMEADC